MPKSAFMFHDLPLPFDTRFLEYNPPNDEDDMKQ